MKALVSHESIPFSSFFSGTEPEEGVIGRRMELLRITGW
jgi:hypothetical protein